MDKQVFDSDQMRREHTPNPDTKTVVLRRCWSVIFDVGGNAPANATAASFNTKELAEQALILFAAQEDDNKVVSIVVAGRRHSQLPTYSVEGYAFDTGYRVIEDWQTDDKILKSLEDLTGLCDGESNTDLPDGVFLDEDDAAG
jgi:hypothetical protein